MRISFDSASFLLSITFLVESSQMPDISLSGNVINETRKKNEIVANFPLFIFDSVLINQRKLSSNEMFFSLIKL